MLATRRPWCTRSLVSSLLCTPLRRHWNRDTASSLLLNGHGRHGGRGRGREPERQRCAEDVIAWARGSAAEFANVDSLLVLFEPGLSHFGPPCVPSVRLPEPLDVFDHRGLHRVALVPGFLHARRPRCAREGCHRATRRGLQPPAPSLSVIQRRKDVVDAEQQLVRDEGREQRQAGAAPLTAGLLTHHGHDQLAQCLVIGCVQSSCADQRRRPVEVFLTGCRRRLCTSHAREAVSKSMTTGFPTRTLPRAPEHERPVRSRRRRRWQK